MDINFILFQNFETLDALGPAELLGCIEEYRLRFFSREGGAIVSKQGVPVITEPFEKMDRGAVALIPGGLGTRPILADPARIAGLREIASDAGWVLTVCTGSALLAVTGLIDGKRATTNKNVFDWVTSLNQNVNWVRQARWQKDGKFYTSSGVSAGMDMTLDFIADRFSEEKAQAIAAYAEYRWNRNLNDDPFA